MFHHSSESYAVAASQAAREARAKFEATIEKGKQSAWQVVEQVQDQVPKDRIARAQVLRVEPSSGGQFDLIIPDEKPLPLHQHALFQVIDKTGVSRQYANNLMDMKSSWTEDLLAYNVNEMLEHSESRHLVRSIGDREVRGFLSDRFRRLDSRPLLDAFMSACQELSAIPVEGFALDTKVRMRAVLPHVFEPIPNEVMLFGIEWGNSDFGDGGHQVRLFNERIWCTNRAITEEVLRQVHLGKRLDDNIAYSARTYELDTRTNASALRDVIHDALSPVKVNGYLEYIRQAAENTIGEKDVTRILKQQLKLGKGDAEAVEQLFKSPDVQNLPPGSTAYRLSNAISFFSQTEGMSSHKKLELQQAAGELLPHGKYKAFEV